MPFNDTDRGLYNIVLVTNPPCGGEPYRYSEIVNHQPEEWARAVK